MMVFNDPVPQGWTLRHRIRLLMQDEHAQQRLSSESVYYLSAKKHMICLSQRVQFNYSTIFLLCSATLNIINMRFSLKILPRPTAMTALTPVRIYSPVAK